MLRIEFFFCHKNIVVKVVRVQKSNYTPFEFLEYKKLLDKCSIIIQRNNIVSGSARSSKSFWNHLVKLSR